MVTIKYARVNYDGIIQKTKDLTKRLFGRIMEDTDLEYVETRDLELMKDCMKLFNETLEKTEEAQEIINYQTELMEEAVREIRDVKVKVEKLENRK